MATLKVPVGAQDHIEGNAEAACTLLEYGDYQCPHCGAAYPMVKQLQKRFGNRLRFVFRNFPMSNLHAQAQAAAETAEFAASQGQFWPMHDLLFENQTRLGGDLYAELAAQLALDPAALELALANRTYTHRVRADFTGGVRSGVNGTPTFYIQNKRYDSSVDFDSLSEAIEKSVAE